MEDFLSESPQNKLLISGYLTQVYVYIYAAFLNYFYY